LANFEAIARTTALRRFECDRFQFTRQVVTAIEISDREVICFFCGDCGTRLFHNPARNPKITNVKPGTLDNTSWLKPVGNLWTRRAQKWVFIDECMLNYDGQPSDFSPIFEQFRTYADHP